MKYLIIRDMFRSFELNPFKNYCRYDNSQSFIASTWLAIYSKSICSIWKRFRPFFFKCITKIASNMWCVLSDYNASKELNCNSYIMQPTKKYLVTFKRNSMYLIKTTRKTKERRHLNQVQYLQLEYSNTFSIIFLWIISSKYSELSLKRNICIHIKSSTNNTIHRF